MVLPVDVQEISKEEVGIMAERIIRKRVSKVIVSNKSVLRAKYGAGLAAILSALDDYVQADMARGLTTIVVWIDDSRKMRALGGSAVTQPKDCKANKRAIDVVYCKYLPAYLMILGSIDVIPHQDLANPLSGDGDAYAYSDLPYACDHDYTQNITDFLGPTRVVGRLPDLTNGQDPGYLASLLSVAANYQSLSTSSYKPAFGLTAKVWKVSTQMSLNAAFGLGNPLFVSPPDGPSWTSQQLSPLSFFINCHGAPADPNFYGQQGWSYPKAITASGIDGRTKKGMVCAAECCYGAELYDPQLANGQMGIVNTCLGNKGYAFFGSSTIAYGPPNSNGEADLICQYFSKYVLNGYSCGRATLAARQKFAQAAQPLDGAELKTLAQFNLMGDPSIHAVKKRIITPEPVRTKTFAKLKEYQDEKAVEEMLLLSRRSEVLERGQKIDLTSPRLSDSITMSKKIRSILKEVIQTSLQEVPKSAKVSAKKKSVKKTVHQVFSSQSVTSGSVFAKAKSAVSCSVKAIHSMVSREETESTEQPHIPLVTVAIVRETEHGLLPPKIVCSR